MAAFMRHGVFKTGQLVSPKNVLPRTYATKAEKRKGIDRKVGPKIDPRAQSLAAKGFLRAQKEYTPPADVQSRLENIFKSVLGSTNNDTKLDDKDKKFKVLVACETELNHEVPNFLLHTLETLGDIKNYFTTAVDVKTPLDKLKNMDLPENLHIQFDYLRFHPDTDTVFQGKTAFNQSNTIVTGLKYKGRYPGYMQKQKIPT